MLRNARRPVQRARLQRDLVFQPLSDTALQEGLPALLEQFDEAFLFRDERVDLDSLPVKIVGNGTLF